MMGKLTVLSIIFACLLLFSGPVLSQEKAAAEQKEMTAEEQAMMERWMKFATPGEHHKFLDAFVGSWNFTMTWWEKPGAEPQTGTGTAEHTWIMDGRYVQEDVQSSWEGKPFRGLGFMGYDNFKQKYFSFWIDNMSTAMATAWGTCDPDGKIFTMLGEYDDVMSGKANKKSRSVSRIVDQNKWIAEMWSEGDDGVEFKMVEFVYTRR